MSEDIRSEIIDKDPKPTFEELLQAAREERWDFVDEHLKDENITRENFSWAFRTGMIDTDDNVRDFAATILMASSIEIDTIDQTRLRAFMEDDSYNIVRYRLAMALYKRGDRYPETLTVMNEAAQDKDVGEFAQAYLRTA